jgi:hypothetical protein
MDILRAPKPEEPPTRPEERAASATGAATALVKREATTREATGTAAAADLLRGSSSRRALWQTTGEGEGWQRPACSLAVGAGLQLILREASIMLRSVDSDRLVSQRALLRLAPKGTGRVE